jgi:hypothetical protein
MYSTCLFCNASLGSNEVVEHFPVGRRLAFDAAKGRLWVVCRSCERWCLSPLEERWEAIEECERLFRDTRLRVSTENMGLARLREGLELVRVGEPMRPEMAAWRYGDQFGRRRKRAIVRTGLGLGALGAVLAGGAAAGVSIAAFGGLYTNIIQRITGGNPNAVVARIPEGGRILEVRRKDLDGVRLDTGSTRADLSLRIKVKKETIEFDRDNVVRVAGQLLPAINRFGGTRRQVEAAVDILDVAGDVEQCFTSAAHMRTQTPMPVNKLNYPVRLALEMAAHEEQERRALEGELTLLETAWKEAEEIAAISDSLLIPSGVEDWLRKLRGT